MKIKFLRKDPENMRLILIFTGWSTGPEVGAGIDIPGWDVAVAYDFTELNPDTSFLDSYYTVYLFGWSLGVFAASRTLPHERITAAFAVNRTLDFIFIVKGMPFGTGVFMLNKRCAALHLADKFVRQANHVDLPGQILVKIHGIDFSGCKQTANGIKDFFHSFSFSSI